MKIAITHVMFQKFIKSTTKLWWQFFGLFMLLINCPRKFSYFIGILLHWNFIALEVSMFTENDKLITCHLFHVIIVDKFLSGILVICVFGKRWLGWRQYGGWGRGLICKSLVKLYSCESKVIMFFGGYWIIYFTHKLDRHCLQQLHWED